MAAAEMAAAVVVSVALPWQVSVHMQKTSRMLYFGSYISHWGFTT